VAARRACAAARDAGGLLTATNLDVDQLRSIAVVGFKIDEMETKFLHANSILEFSHSQDP
jgi:hypothetical protein